MMLGRELETNALQRAGRTLLSDRPVAAFHGYGKKGVIEPFDLQVRPGEIVGFGGTAGIRAHRDGGGYFRRENRRQRHGGD